MSGGRRRAWTLGMAALLWLSAACAPVAPQARPGTVAQPEPLLVAAAASLEGAFNEIGDAFEAETGQPVTFVFGASGNLATQIENGAPFDVFAAANVEFVERLADGGLILPDTQAVYAQGRLALAVNRAAGVTATNLEDLLDPAITRVAIANPQLAPYGLAAQQALHSRGLWESLELKIVYGENVRQALQYVQTGDAQAGLVALSIVSVPEVSYTMIDAALHDSLDQALVVIAGRPHEETARAFAAFVLGSGGREILGRHGFTPPGEF